MLYLNRYVRCPSQRMLTVVPTNVLEQTSRPLNRHWEGSLTGSCSFLATRENISSPL